MYQVSTKLNFHNDDHADACAVNESLVHILYPDAGVKIHFTASLTFECSHSAMEFFSSLQYNKRVVTSMNKWFALRSCALLDMKGTTLRYLCGDLLE